MRLHHLTVTAFGPFAGTVSVDFDALSEAGLFLLTGATGAGKTSVLDAVCFALYGQVPGDRAGAKHLRSDHAAADVAPEVVLRLSVGDRELSFTRSPAWRRPKLRGTGETKVLAHVLVEERVDGRWTVLSNRLDDAGLLVVDLLGMSSTQFTQVAMLPQGRFQAFLRATSAERHNVLQQLFRTDRFERIEGWLVERRTATRRRAEAAADAVTETVNRLQEASGDDLESAWLEDLDRATTSGDLERWAHRLGSGAVETETASRRVAEDADQVVAEATEVLTTAQQTVELNARAAQARAVLEHWDARAEDVSGAELRLEEHRRALPLTELARARRTAQAAADRAAQAWSARQAALPHVLDRPALLEARQAAHDAHALAAAFGPRAASREAARSELAELRTQLQGLETGVAELELTLGEQPGIIADAVAAVHEARAASARHPVVLAQVERLETQLLATRRAELLGLELAAARTDVLTATEAAQSAKESYLDLREARINGMAGELAGQLASGCSCPVCGSATHPSPAPRVAPGAAGADEDQARKLLDDAEFELQARRVAVATLEGELAGLDEQLTDVDRTAIPDRVAAARDEVERLEPLVAALEVLVAREDSCRTALQTAEAELKEALLERVRLRERAARLEETLVAVEQEWTALLSVPGAGTGEDRVTDLASLVAARRERATALDAAVTDLDAALSAAAGAAELTERLDQAATEAGFDGTDAALAALIADAEQERLADLLTQAATAVAGATGLLATAEVQAAAARPVPDLADLRTSHARAVAASRSASSALAAATARRARLEQLTVDLDARLDAWRPLQEHHRTVAELASFVEGKSVDNVPRMRLAAYVLAERLRQVVDAANERLVTMTDQRYALEHTDDRGYGEQRGGLSLRVRDDWNGVHRDPATLSGGETFVVSLALALGLADTVAHEAGGTDIDTLFIDEGFGSLDADTLEDVMDTLDSLRDGGRVVGLVSHVPELRSRITTQLEVTKGRTGSSLRPTVSPG